MKQYQIWVFIFIAFVVAGLGVYASIQGDYAMAVGLCNLSLILLLFLKVKDVESLRGKG